MHKEWKAELDEIRLSGQQKEKMKRGIYEKKPQKSHRLVPIILPLFVVGALWLVWVTVGGQSIVPQTAATTEKETAEHIFTFSQLMWTLTAQILIGIAFSLTIIVAKKVPQVQHMPFWRKMAAATKPRGMILYILLLVAVMLGIVYMSLTFSWAQAVLEWLIVIAVLVDWMLISMLTLRRHERSRCPHCEEVFTLRQFLAFSQSKCKECGGKFYLLQKGNQKMLALQYSGMAIAYLIIPVGFSILQMLVFFAGYVAFLFLYVFKYTMHYDKNQPEMPPPLW